MKQENIDDVRFPPMDGLPTFISHAEARDLITGAVLNDREIRVAIPKQNTLENTDE